MKLAITYLRADWGIDGVGRINPGIHMEEWTVSNSPSEAVNWLQQNGFWKGAVKIAPSAILSIAPQI